VRGSSSSTYAICLDRLKQPMNKMAGFLTTKYKVERDKKYLILYYILQPFFQVEGRADSHLLQAAIASSFHCQFTSCCHHIPEV